MTDFAAADRRSVRAHIKGYSLRAAVYSVFLSVESVLGRSAKAPQDFERVSRYVFFRRDALARVGSMAGYIATAGIGLFGGGLLFHYMG